MKNTQLLLDCRKFINNIAKTTGDTITSYHWREAIELVYNLEAILMESEEGNNAIREEHNDIAKNSNNDISQSYENTGDEW